MSPEEATERYVRKQVDQTFDEVFGRSVNGRIKMAAYAVGEQVGILRALLEEQSVNHEAVPSAPKSGGISIFMLGFKGIFVPNEAGDGVETEEQKALLKQLGFHDEDDAILKARMARDAALEGARAVYNLSERQARRALRLAETSFYLFNVADPNQQ